jgi:hypothetical protein
MSDNSNTGGGLGFFSALTILFIGLKMTGYIEWSWWWVLAPIWMTYALAFVAAVVYVILKEISDSRAEEKKRKARLAQFQKYQIR